jgi:hypothetical protein
MKLRSELTLLLCGVLLLAAGCGGDEATPSPTTPQSLPAAPTLAAPAQEPSAAAASDAAQTAEQAAAINSYRLRITTRSESARGADLVEIDGAYVKEPPAEELRIRYQDGAQSMSTVVVDGVRYMQAGDQWLQAPEAAFAFDELTLITPDDVTGLLSRMTQVGVEEVNVLQAMHYRGGKEMIPVVGSASDQLDVSDLAFAEMNLWVDQATNVVTRMTLTANDAEEAVALEVVFDYYDFNAAITIEAPSAVSVGPADGGMAATSTALPGDALSQLLGFRLLMPTGSTVESSLGTTMVTVLTPFTVAEAQRMIEQTLPANGYTLVTKAEPAPGQFTYLYQQGSKVVNITVSDGGGGAARLQFVTAP